MNKKITSRKMAIIGLSCLAFSLFTTSVRADLIKNGGFTDVNGPNSTPGTSTSTLAGGQSASIYKEVDYWTLSDSIGSSNVRGYLYLPGTATSAGARYTHGGTAIVTLSGLPFTDDSDTLIGGGGNFVGVDSGFDNIISQNILGLLPNTKYQLSFDYAATQQTGSTGATTDFWKVALGGNVALGIGTQSTLPITIPSQGFSGWIRENNLFFTTPSTIPTTGELLEFMAVGTPSTIPPFLLLDNVTLQAVPEPASWLLIGIGLLGFLTTRRSLKKRA